MFQNAVGAQRFKVRIGVVQKVCVVVHQKGLDVIKNKTKLVRVLHRVQTRPVLGSQRRSETVHGSHVQNLTHLEERKREMCFIFISIFPE